MKFKVNNKEKLLVIGLVLLFAILLRLFIESNKSRVPSLEGLEYDGSTPGEFSSSVLDYLEGVVQFHARSGSRAPLIQRSHGWGSRTMLAVFETLPLRLRSL